MDRKLGGLIVAGLLLVGAQVSAADKAEPFDVRAGMALYHPFFDCVRTTAQKYAVVTPSATATEIGVTAMTECRALAEEANTKFNDAVAQSGYPRPPTDLPERLFRQVLDVGRDTGVAEAVKARAKK